jgi:hypothetical protein
LNSKQAVKMSVFVVRAFVRLREALAIHKNLARKLEALEKKVGDQDVKIQAVFDAIKDLMKEPGQLLNVPVELSAQYYFGNREFNRR